MRPRTYIVAAAAAVLLALCAAPRTASANPKQYRFVGVHPIPKGQGGGVCHINVPHVHIYAPVDVKVQYRDHDGWKMFVGDPVAYGWDGPKTAYYGHHPIAVHAVVDDYDGDDVEYCYLEGPHYHVYAPPPDIKMELRGGAYWYVGSFPRAYVEARPVYDPIDVYYEPIEYARPVVLLGPPPHWHDVLIDVDVGGAAVVEAPAPVVDAHAVGVVGAGVHAGVEVHVPVPTFQMSVGIGAAPVVVEERRDVIYVHDHDYKHKHGRALGHRKGKGHW